jgi:hypothetical protein
MVYIVVQCDGAIKVQRIIFLSIDNNCTFFE